MTLLSPYLLLFLLILPGVWWLVRAIPPQPREQRFPSLILLRQLTTTRQNAAHTPLWLLLLRLAALALLILAFSRPLYIPPRSSHVPHNLMLILDNGWAATTHWAERTEQALALGEATLRAGGRITLFLSAPEADGHMPSPLHPSSPASLKQSLATLKPQLWPSDRLALARQLQNPAMHDILRTASVMLLSDGLAQPGDDALRTALQDAASRHDIRWPRCALTRLSLQHGTPTTILAETLPSCPPQMLHLMGMKLTPNGHFALQASTLIPTNTPRPFNTQLPHNIAYDALSLPAIAGPAGMVLLPGTAAQRRVGLLHLNGDDRPLTGGSFYLEHALHDITPYQEGTVDSLLPQHPTIIIATDGSLPEASLNDMLHWVREGGILIRFAGPDLAHQNQQGMQADAAALLPVPLLSGMRQLGGPMSWGNPQPLAPFPPNTPFAGLTIPHDATISRQLLAQPTDELSRHVWATLTDGTPLVTARQEGNGLLILFHITATADWSSLPLSGLFPQMMERLITRTPFIQHHDTTAHSSADTLAPWRLLDAEKTLITPPTTVRPLLTSAEQTADALHPVGFYGGAAQRHPLNLADHQPPLAEEPALGSLQQAGRAVVERPFWPGLMLLAIGFLLLDMLLSLARAGILRLPRRGGTILTIGLSLLIASLSPISYAAPPTEQNVPPAALAIRLAHIQTGDAATDDAVQQGLEGLTRFLNQRSTTHLDSPVGVVPGRDDLAFYPLLYWPILPSTQLDEAGRQALSNYIQHDGMILIDEMGAGSPLDGSDGHATRSALKAATSGLPIPPLMPLGEQHTLSHTFYLLHDFPGRIAGQTVYVARQEENDESESVSPVIIGNGDWAHAWAVDSHGEHPFAVIPDGETQRTLAYRFGFNTIIYALTGNYKNDQRHYPEMLKRLKNSADDTMEGPTDEGEAP